MYQGNIGSLLLAVTLVSIILFVSGYVLCYITHIGIPRNKGKQLRKEVEQPKYKTYKKDYSLQLQNTTNISKPIVAEIPGIRRNGKIPDEKKKE